MKCPRCNRNELEEPIEEKQVVSKVKQDTYICEFCACEESMIGAVSGRFTGDPQVDVYILRDLYVLDNWNFPLIRAVTAYSRSMKFK